MCLVSPALVTSSGLDDHQRTAAGIDAIGNMTLYPFDARTLYVLVAVSSATYSACVDRYAGLQTIPAPLPSELLTLQVPSLYIRGLMRQSSGLPDNELTQLKNVPTGLMALSDDDPIQNQDWTSIKHMYDNLDAMRWQKFHLSSDLSGNRLVSFNYVNLSKSLIYSHAIHASGVDGCSLNSFVATAATFDALNALSIATNATATKGLFATTLSRVDAASQWACDSFGGRMRNLAAKVSIPVCITGYALRLGLGLGAVALVFLAALFWGYPKPTQVFNILDKTVVRRSSSSSSVSLMDERGVDLDVAILTPYKIDSSTYAVVGDVSIATGSDVDVWRGHCQGEPIVIKRL
ncbi:hypothetical protein SPRG_14292 [Saprolegnia parasitica CBS 223.65]|uniref:Uncharacterized protein n=1 Tax=Saprolegnia parasitica (strain CBS 223.65) TaxID=695850 RepID=A0A067BYH4_SAPPC|nr:hypothetical protein SPRG_14292 [Saprolegnia parasitica CBS 223.65]KDO19612.1 hypothetical protein SPRG_14292 [Saprolegnia parasitica CBS 223.65]|eukprot:XP_012209664.1 hypothetical protein SPRG_14292 [Saprolegnia parasitica CBS 223.65]